MAISELQSTQRGILLVYGIGTPAMSLVWLPTWGILDLPLPMSQFLKEKFFSVYKCSLGSFWRPLTNRDVEMLF